jgi:hypothetical protein
MPSTQIQQWKRLAAANIVLAANQRSDYADQVRTLEQGPLAVANESVIFPFDAESSKLRVYGGAAGGTIEAFIHGWTYSGEDGVWMPELLGKATGTTHTVGRNIAGTLLYPVISWVVDAGTGNVRVVNGTGLKIAASLVFDAQGHQWGEVAFKAGAIVTVNGYRKNC